MRKAGTVARSIKHAVFFSAPVSGTVKGFRLVVSASALDGQYPPYYCVYRRRQGDQTVYSMTTVPVSDVLCDGVAPTFNTIMDSSTLNAIARDTVQPVVDEANVKRPPVNDPVVFDYSLTTVTPVMFKGLRNLNSGDEICIMKHQPAIGDFDLNYFVTFYYGQ